MTLANGYPYTPEDLRTLVRAAGLSRSDDEPPELVPSRSDGGVVIVIGAFDGVHLGHRDLISACVEDARTRGVPAVVVTFDPDPSELLASQGHEERLLGVSDRVRLCRTLGVDDVLVLPFDHDLAALSPRAFLEMLGECLGPLRAVHVGDNFRFGARGAGDVGTLAALGCELGFDAVSRPLFAQGGKTVSSTRVRSLLAQGKVAEAAELLNRCHYVRGTVAHGRGEGTSFGFPTANVECDSRICMPSEGVYACIVTDGVRAWPAATNVGKPPTFTGDHDSFFLEANLIGFEGDLYGSELSVLFVEWLRASRPFSSLAELEQVVLGNIDWVRCNIGAAGVEVSS